MKSRLIISIFIICSITTSNAQQSPLNVLQTNNVFTVQLTLPQYNVRDTSLVNLFDTQEIFQYIKITEFGCTADVGFPILPQITVDLPIAWQASNLQIIMTNPITEEITLNKRIIPMQEDIRNVDVPPAFKLNQSYYSSNGNMYDFRWKLSEPYVVFGKKGISLSLFPFVYNPQTNKVIVLKQATFTLSYQLNGSQPIPPIGSTVSETRENYLSNFFNNSSITNSSNIIYRSSVLNTAEVVKGRYLMITHPSFQTTLQSFADYKRNLGFEVTVVSTSTTGNTVETIKSYIQNRYDNPETRPDYLLLVGDHEHIPASDGNSSGEEINNPITDLYYSCLDGDDLIADVIIGRFSVSSTVELSNILIKSTFMEMNLHRLDKKVKLVTGKDRDCDHIAIPWFCNMAKSYMENSFKSGHEFAEKKTFTPLGYSSQKLYQPNNTQIANSVNDNPLFFIYSGHGYFTYLAGGSFDIFESSINSYSNTHFPFVFSFACKTGNFAYSSPCIGEHFIRNVRGGIIYFGSSVTSLTESDKIIEKSIFGESFKDETNIGMIVKLGMEHYKNRFWSFLNATNRYLKAYNLLGDPSLNKNGEKVLSVPFVQYTSTATLQNPSNIPVTWSVTGNFLLSNPTNNSVTISRIGVGSGTVTAQFAGLGAAVEDIITNDFSISGPSTLYSQATYTIDNLPPGAAVEWSVTQPYIAPTIYVQNSGTVILTNHYGIDGIGTHGTLQAVVTVGNQQITLTKDILFGWAVASIGKSRLDMRPGEYILEANTTNDPNTSITSTWSVTGPSAALVDFPYPEDASYADKAGRLKVLEVYTPGYYTVCATANDGNYTTQPYCTDFYIDDYKPAGGMFSLSPNPVTTSVTITMDETKLLNSNIQRTVTNPKSGNWQIQLWNSSGLVKQVETNQTSYRLDLTGVPPGFYYVHVIKDGQTYRRQLVVQ